MKVDPMALFFVLFALLSVASVAGGDDAVTLETYRRGATAIPILVAPFEGDEEMAR